MLEFPNINPIIISFGPLGISWYSLSYIAGIVFGWSYALILIKKQYAIINIQDIDNFITWLIIGVIGGGRIGYVVFYNPVEYFRYPIEILQIYKGGMSFHGGLLGVLIMSFIFTQKNNIRYFILTDIIAAVSPIALFFGRIANFINAELYGRIADVPWSFIFPRSDGMPRHPSQLYEALFEGLVLFFILYFVVIIQQGLKKIGLVSGLFLTLYASFRIFIEQYREPDAHIGMYANLITTGQLLCIPMLIIGVFLIKNYDELNVD